jgi:HEPN domain-containing protein
LATKPGSSRPLKPLPSPTAVQPSFETLRAAEQVFLRTLPLLDEYLDLTGVPVAFRKFKICSALNFFHKLLPSDPMYSEYAAMHEACQRVGAHFAHAVEPWYFDVYHEQAYVPPLAGVVLGHAPLPVYVVVPDSGPPLVPNTDLCWDAVVAMVGSTKKSKEKLYQGLRLFRRLPWTDWVQLAVADYDTAIDNFRANRPAYHLVLWHTLQVAEKTLKAVLVARNVPRSEVEVAGHSLGKLIALMNKAGAQLSVEGAACLARIADLTNAHIRYEADMHFEVRKRLRAASVKAHHELLMFFFHEGQALWVQVAISPYVEGNSVEGQIELLANFSSALNAYTAHVQKQDEPVANA